MLSPQTASPASWKPPTAGGDTTDDEEGPRPAPRADDPAAAPAAPPAAQDAAPAPPPPAAAPLAPEHVLLEASPPPPPSKWKEGDKVIARWHLGCHYPGTIHAVKANGVYAVSFDDGDYDDNVIENHIRAAPAPTPTDEPPAPAPAPALPPPGSRITVRFSDGIDYGGTITELVDEHHARVLYDDGQSETVRFPDPDVRVLRAAPAAATPAAAAGGPIRVRTAGGREAIVLEKMQRGWFRVELDGNANDEGGANERKSLRRPQLAVGQDHLLDAAPQAPAARPAPAPTDEAAPAPALGDKDAQQVAALEKLHESLKDKPNLIVCRKPLEDFGFRCGATDQQQNRFDALPPQSLHSIEDILGGQYAQTYSLNSVPKLIAYLEGVLNRLSGGRLFPSPSAPKKKRGYEAPAPKITERARPRWSSEEERRLRELVAELGETRWPAIAMRLGTGRTGAAVELRWATLRQKSHGRPPRAAAEAAPATDGRERVRTAGGRVATIIERRSRGWLFVELDGVANDEGGAHERKSIRATTTTALHGAATRKRPGTGGAAPRPAQRPRLVSRGGNDDDDKDARIAELEAALAQAQQAPVAPVAPPAAALASVTGRLRELASLRASGALTEAQFERAKNTELGLQ
ncbi:unnamed protein product [Pelagomonas calceolata]|uniref:Uncharacterized protein n=3 Tax=Pelagomonas calceolata TaxID=35677 RepID=A0A8J2WST3_9STRA|nr:unnamed protein product [Pelagomonas calceolata]